MQKQGRTFDCAKCPEATQKIRRCWEERWDFTAADGVVFPIRVSEGGGLYGFCPAKATRNQEATGLFELLLCSVEQKALLVAGGLSDQPSWFVQLLAWFAPIYDDSKFISRAKMILGDGGASGGATKAPAPKRARARKS